MLPVRTLCCALLITASADAGSMDYAISVPLLSLYNRFGVDSQGNILIAANPTSCTLPTLNPLSTCGPIWVGKLDPFGQNLLFATYLGTSASTLYTAVAGITGDAAGNIILAAHTTAPDMPTVNAIQAAPKSQFTALYVAKLTPDGSRLVYATYLGGTGGQSAISLVVDGSGGAYVSGWTTSNDFPSTPQSLHEPSGTFASVVVKVNSDGTLGYAATFPFALYFDQKPIQLDASGEALIASTSEVVTLSSDGLTLARIPLPPWARTTGVCTAETTGVTSCAQSPWVLPRAAGGYQFTGSANNGVPITSDAIQFFTDAKGYLRVENGRLSQPALAGPVGGFAVDTEDRSRVYAATPNGLFVSEDNGLTWTALHDGNALAVAIDPFDSNRLYLSLNADPPLYRSTDRGTTWAALANGIPAGARATSVAADPKVPGLLYAAAGWMLRSTDGGDTWDARSVGPSHQDMSPSASTSTASKFVQVDPTHPGWAYVAGITSCIGFCPMLQNIARTQDGGNSWTDIASSGAGVFTSAFAVVDPNSGDLADQAGMIYRNGDLTNPQRLFPGEITSIAFDPANPGTIYLAVHVAKGPGSGYFIVQSGDDRTT